MNFKKYIGTVILVISMMTACNDNWDNHYEGNEPDLSNVNMEVVAVSITDYLKSIPEYSELVGQFEECGVWEQVTTDSHFTVLAVKNADWQNEAGDSEEKQLFLANTYISSVAVSPTNLKAGETLEVWTGKLLNITTVNSDGNANIGFAFNDVKAIKVVKTTNGYVYELADMLYTPQTMYEFIMGLEDEYSIFRNQILALEIHEFDEKNSEIIGVDAMGNNIYDTLRVSSLPIFDKYKFDLKSETLNGTLFVPTNKQIEDAIANAKERLIELGWTRGDTTLVEWCYQSLFYATKLGPEKFQSTDPEEIDLTSVFGKQWRTTINKVDTTNPVELSNGVVYYITDFRIPSNVLMWRMKEMMYQYDYLSEADKEEYYTIENFSLYQWPRVRVGPWTPSPEWPEHSNITQVMYLTDNTQPGYVYYKAHNYTDNGDGTYTITKRQLPPGEYDFFMGFGQCGGGVEMAIYLNDKYIVTLSAADQNGTNYDRYGDLGPEGEVTGDKAANYDTDGIKWATITIEGDGPVDLDFRLECVWETGQDIQLHHWCFRPSKNFY